MSFSTGFFNAVVDDEAEVDEAPVGAIEDGHGAHVRTQIDSHCLAPNPNSL